MSWNKDLITYMNAEITRKSGNFSRTGNFSKRRFLPVLRDLLRNVINKARYNR